MIYFDNAATTFPKPECVIRDLNYCLKNYCGNAGRSSNTLSIKSSEAIYSARENIAEMLGIDSPERVVFTYNATYALNIAIKSFITEKCHVLISDMEHNSVVRPLESLKKKLGVEYSCFDSSGNIEASIKSLIRKDTKGIISTLSSNVNGREISIETLSRVAKENKLFLIVDSSQLIGHKTIDIRKYPCDVLCAPGHKALFGIQGSGFAVFKNNSRLETLIEGGSGSESKSQEMPLLLPEGYEAGTLSTPAIVSLGSGINFIKRVSEDAIRNKITSLSNHLKNSLDKPCKINLYESYGGIILFEIKGIPNESLGRILDSKGVCVRSGFHCAPLAHRSIGTYESGATRISLSYLNTERDIIKFSKIIKNILMEY